jgi:hypothetical protein
VLDLLDAPLGELAGDTATSSSSSSSRPQAGSGSTLQLVQLAGLTGTSATSSLRAGCAGRDASLPGPVARPAGPIALIGPRQGNLWLVNALGQPLLLPLTHPGTCGVVVLRGFGCWLAPQPGLAPLTSSCSLAAAANTHDLSSPLVCVVVHAACARAHLQASTRAACVRKGTLLAPWLSGAMAWSPRSTTAWRPSWRCRAASRARTWLSWGCRGSASPWRRSCAWSQVSPLLRWQQLWTLIAL